MTDLNSPGCKAAQLILDSFYEAVVACGRVPSFKPALRVAAEYGPIRYDVMERAVVIVPYELLSGAAQAAMERFAAIGTLGLDGRRQYEEVFNRLLVAHEMGHWLQDIARRPLNRWQAEYEANRLMVAFWREHPELPPAPSSELRLENFIAQPPGWPNPVPEEAEQTVEAYFNSHLAEIETNPVLYAGFQKMMVREALVERPVPSFCQLLTVCWPNGTANG